MTSVEIIEHIKDIVKTDSILNHVDTIDSILSRFPVDNYIAGKIKGKIQHEAKWALMNGGIFAGATGVGKSKVGIDLVRNRTLIVVPTVKLRDITWKDEFVKWGKDWNLVERCCYRSLHKFVSNEYDTIILDESHNTTDDNFDSLEKMTYKRLVMLTASQSDDKHIISRLNKIGCRVKYSVSLDQAVKLRLVSPFEIVKVEVSLNNVDRTVLRGSKNKKFFVTEQAAYDYVNDRVNNAMANNERCDYLFRERMHLIYGLKSKTNAGKWIFENVIKKGDRTILFCSTIAQANEVCKHRYHSGVKKDTSFDKFRKKEINAMSCVNAMNEGQNFDDVNSAIIFQLKKNGRYLIQQTGRIIRYSNDHIGYMWLIVCTGTEDEIWYNSAVKDFDRSKIKVISFEELKSKHVSV